MNAHSILEASSIDNLLALISVLVLSHLKSSSTLVLICVPVSPVEYMSQPAVVSFLYAITNTAPDIELDSNAM